MGGDQAATLLQKRVTAFQAKQQAAAAPSTALQSAAAVECQIELEALKQELLELKGAVVDAFVHPKTEAVAAVDVDTVTTLRRASGGVSKTPISKTTEPDTVSSSSRFRLSLTTQPADSVRSLNPSVPSLEAVDSDTVSSHAQPIASAAGGVMRVS